MLDGSRLHCTAAIAKAKAEAKAKAKPKEKAKSKAKAKNKPKEKAKSKAKALVKAKAKSKAKARVNALDEIRTVTLNAVQTLADGLDHVRLDAVKAAKILSNRIDAVNTSLNTMNSSLGEAERDAKILKDRLTAVEHFGPPILKDSVILLEGLLLNLKDNVELLTDRVGALERWAWRPYERTEGAKAANTTDGGRWGNG